MSLIVAVGGGILGVPGYLKLIKRADDNAKERGEHVATGIQDLTMRVAKRAPVDAFAWGRFGLMMLYAYARTIWIRGDVEKIKELERKKNH